MIDVGFWEVAMIGVMALIILGPERLPKVARTAGMWIGKARSMLREVKADIKSEIDASELDELKSMGKDIQDAGTAFKSQVESVDKSVQSEASEMDKAIGDALSKPAGGAPAKTTAKPIDANTAVSKETAKKPATTNKTSSQKAGKKNNKKKTTRKKPAQKKTAKKKVTNKKAAKASSADTNKA